MVSSLSAQSEFRKKTIPVQPETLICKSLFSKAFQQNQIAGKIYLCLINMPPFFSIIIPAYNRADLLPDTIKSIQDQTFSDWECIVVDDESKDETKEVIEKLISQDRRINYIFQQNAERSAARNNGARNSKGRYLLFLDSDDSYEPSHLNKLHDFIKQKDFPVALFFTHVCYKTDDGLIKPEIPFMDKGKEFEYILLNPITPSRVCLHRDIFNEFSFDEEIVIVEDLVLWVSIATKFPVFQVPEYTLYYRIHGGNSVDLSRDSYSSRLKGLKKLFRHPKYKTVSEKIPRKIKKHLLAECYFNIARHSEYVHNFKRMNAMLWRSFLSNPFYRNKERLYMTLSHIPVIEKII